MAIPNVNQLMSMLRKMGDPQLQQFAAMHKSDPFILPLAIAEDTARKELRAANQAQAMGGEPPKVADQAIASIGQMPQPQMPPQGPGGPMPQGGPMPPQGGPMPPQGGPMPPQGGPMPPQGAGPAPGGPGGIAALQAPNMAKMADGGIAGYPDEDEIGMAEGGVARYNGATGSVTNALEQAQAPVMQSLQSLQAQLGQAEQMLAAAAKSGDPQSLNYYAQAVQALRTQLSTIAEQNFGNRAAEVMSGLSAAPAAPAASAASQMTPQQRERFSPPGAAPRPGPGPGPGPAPRPGPGAGNRPAGAAPAGPAPAAPMMAMEKPTPEAAKLTAAQFLDRKAIEDQSEQYLKGEEAAITQARMRREAAAANQGKAYSGLEALLKKEEEGTKGQLDQAKAFALIDAGLAMAAGRSPNALQNIAEGLGVGSKRYQGAISDFNKAAKERQKAMADIEQARRAEARADSDAQLKFEERADERTANARKFGVDAIMGAGIKNAEIATRIYDNNVTQAGQDRRTQMELSSREREGAANRGVQREIDRTPAEVRLMEWLRDPKNKQLYESVQASKRAEDRNLKLYEIYTKNKLMLGNMSFEDFAAGLKDATGAAGAGAGEFKVLSSRPK